MNNNESAVEQALQKAARVYNFLCIKFTPCGVNGIPDRIVIGNGYVIFVELKAPHKKPRKNQLAIHRKMQKAGAEIHIIDNQDAAYQLIADIASRPALHHDIQQFYSTKQQDYNESKVETTLKNQCKRHNYLCLKLALTSINGVPDRIIIGDGRVIFVELKAPHKKPRKNQLAIHRKMQKAGAEIYVIDSIDKVNMLIKK